MTDQATEDRPRVAGSTVSALYSAIRGGATSFDAVPGLLKKIIREDLWHEQQLPRSHLTVQYRSFAEFVSKALKTSIEMLRKMCRDDREALDLLDQVTTAPKHLHRHKDDGADASIISITPTHGTTSAYALRKLRKDRPDLLDQVIAGDLSPHAAMVEAGFRRRQITIMIDPAAAARALRKHLDPVQRHHLAQLLVD